MNPTIFRITDTETCDLESGVVEIGSVDVINGIITNPMSNLIDPQKEISFDAMATHHITDKMVKGQPLITDVIDRYKGADYYVAHNAEFDKKMLPELGAPWICTLKMAREVYPEGKHSNQYLRYVLGLDVNVPDGLHAHRALYDCYVTAAIFIHLMNETGWSVERMLEVSNRPSLLRTISFGKYKGAAFADIAKSDIGYLRWLAGNQDGTNENLEYTLNHYLRG
ncbi:exodeoxyribonuclease X [Pragia fontium]|uniref:exodeoxyribonuclease X n=1 Tax=Pragia fontium TaxID=82985 RepID=UPI00064B58C4|nr:exodeoxyribonuclease X [Pragia fontium]AKJ41772.1 exodeoxyribonuclease X [Pragia fontium]